jgi:hypothetical protein
MYIIMWLIVWYINMVNVWMFEFAKVIDVIIDRYDKYCY